MQTLPHHIKQRGKCIYVMYLYDCNSIVTTATNNRTDEEIIRAFTELTEYFKSRVISPSFRFMDNEASTALKMTITTINIKYQLVPPSNHRAKNAERANQTFQKHFIAGLCRVDKDLCLQLCYILLQQSTISQNLLRKSRNLSHLSAYTHIFG